VGGRHCSSPDVQQRFVSSHLGVSGGCAMSFENNRNVVARYYEEVLNGQDLGLIDELAVNDYDEHSPFPGQPNGREGLRARVAAIVAAFSPRFTIRHLVCEGDLVAAHWTNTGTHRGDFMGISPTGRTVTISGIDIHLLRDGKLAEHWHAIEELQMLQQLGLIPEPQGAPS
jgi:predicted ester cyclase